MEMSYTPRPSHTHIFGGTWGDAPALGLFRSHFPHPEQSFALLYFLSQKSLTVASFDIFPVFCPCRSAYTVDIVRLLLAQAMSQQQAGPDAAQC